MKHVFGLLLAASLSGQTVINDTIRAPISGQLFNGRVTIQGPEITYGGQTYARNVLRVDIASGVFLQSLIPNIGATPEGTTYRVTFRTRDGVEWSEWWEVPASAEPLKVFQVRRSSNNDTTGASVPIWKLGEASGRRGRVICSDGTQWGPCSANALGVASFAQAFTSSTAVTIPGATHGLNTNLLIVTVFDGTGKRISSGAVTVNATTFDVVVNFTEAQTGRIVLTKAPAQNVTFASQTTVTLPGATHGFTTQNLAAMCFDGAGKVIRPGTMIVAPTTYDVTFTFTEAQTGRCFVAAASL